MRTSYADICLKSQACLRGPPPYLARVCVGDGSAFRKGREQTVMSVEGMKT
jgi:hypothetical protein